jgi:hypothetical protein
MAIDKSTGKDMLRKKRTELYGRSIDLFQTILGKTAVKINRITTVKTGFAKAVFRIICMCGFKQPV